MPLSQKEAERLANKVRKVLCRDAAAAAADDDGVSPLLSFLSSSSSSNNDDDDNNDDKNDMIIIRKEEIATLWDGMGRIYLITTTKTTTSRTRTSSYSNDTDDDSISIGGSHCRYQFQFIVKYIDHTSRSCRLPVSDKRKVLQSYVNEAKFYKFHSEQLRKQKDIGLPQSYYVESSYGSSTNATTTTIICMSVLQKLNTPIPSSIISSNNNNNNNNNNNKYHHLHLTIQWLASFHAATWQRPYPSSDNPSDNNNDKLEESHQAIQYGSFWHYDTRRPNMWNMMLSDGGWEGRLKLAAKPIYEWLQTKTQLKSWIHGDMKPDNIMMWDNNNSKKQQQQQKQLAVCDFQYVGQGCPCQDLVYFLCTSGNINIAATENDENNNNGDDNRDNNKNNHKKSPLVDIYFDELLSKLLPLISTQNNDTATTKKSSSSSPPMTRHEFDVALEISYCDYMRFLCAVHRHQKQFTKQYNDLIPIVQAILDKIDGGINLGSEEAYRDAIDKYCCL